MNKLRNLSNLRIVVLFSLFTFLPGVLTSAIFGSSNSAISTIKIHLSDFFSGLVVAPFLETALFQLVILGGLIKLFPRRKALAIIVSATLFAISHLLNPTYDLVATIQIFLGCLLINTAYVSRDSKSLFDQVLVSFLVHFVHNFIGLVALFLVAGKITYE
jgi:membrane protease YdiL (CAAX protease family)